VKLGHKVQKKFIGPFLVLEAYPDFCTFKLQNCATQKILPSFIHSNRLKLCDSGRDELFSKYNDVTDTVTDTATTTNDAVTDSTRSLTDSGKTVYNSHTTSLRTNGSAALLPSSVSTQGLSAASKVTTENSTTTISEQDSLASSSSNKKAEKQRKFPVRVFTRSTKRAQKDATGSNTATNASAAAATAITNNSPDVEGRYVSHTSTLHVSAQTLPVNTEGVNGQTGNSAGEFPGWHKIKRILTHQRRGRTMF